MLQAFEFCNEKMRLLQTTSVTFKKAIGIMKNEKNSRKGDSKNPSASREWLLTVKAADYDLEAIKKALKPYRWVGQLEKGEQSTDKNPDGYKHFQLAIINDTPVRFDTLQNKLYGSHFEAGWTRQEMFDYVTKDRTRLDGPFENGDWSNRKEILAVGSKKGQRTDLESVRTAIMDAGMSFTDIMADPSLSKTAAHSLQWVREVMNARDAKVYGTQRTQRNSVYIWGKAGSGKTTFVESFYGLDSVYEITDYRHPFDNYLGQDVIFLDEFDSKIDYQLLLKLMDDSPLLLPARYSNLWAKHTRVIIASNKAPRDIYPWIDGEERIAFYRRLDGIMEDCIDGEESEVYEPRRYFEEQQRDESNVFGAFLGCYDSKHFHIDYEAFRSLGEKYPFPLEDLSRKIDYDSTANQDLPYKRSEDEDLDFDVF